MDILEVIALLSLCIACIKLGMEINKTQKKRHWSKFWGWAVT